MTRPRLVALVAIILLGIEATWIVRQWSSPVVAQWPAPTKGFNDQRIDYEAPKFPDAKVATVPHIDLGNLPEEPVAFAVPDVRVNHGMIFEGTIRHPSPQLTAAIVTIKIKNRLPKKPSMGLTGHAKGQGGQLSFHFEERTKVEPGQYDVIVEMRYRTTDPDQPNLPLNRQMVTSITAKGTLNVLE